MLSCAFLHLLCHFPTCFVTFLCSVHAWLPHSSQDISLYVLVFPLYPVHLMYPLSLAYIPCNLTPKV
ncbi:hypothetical protein EDB89DRAFT_2029259 [Lactarius sanguifluus]|nr:hypothetical protein EDB89DRAFT_2029259 [Lactarius sanguifluus]